MGAENSNDVKKQVESDEVWKPEKLFKKCLSEKPAKTVLAEFIKQVFY
jgi:hypothetical protein